MSNYNEKLEQMVVSLNDFIKVYENTANNEPFSYKILNTLKQHIVNYEKKLSEVLEKSFFYIEDYNKDYEEVRNTFTEKQKILSQKLKHDAKEIKQKYQVKYDALKDEIKEKELEIHFEENTILMDIDFFILANEQNLDLYVKEYEENIAKFNYQIQIAQDAYENNTMHFNNLLENDLKELDNKHMYALMQNDKDSERIISHYQKKVYDLNEILDSKMQDFKNYQNNYKGKRRTESIELNDTIRALMDIRNEKNLYAKRNYNRQQAEAQEDKEIKQQEYQLDSQKLSKEFVINMGRLDEKARKLKETLEANLDYENRTLQYRLLELTKEQEIELKKALTKKRNKLLIQNINRSFYRYKEIERKNTEKSIKYLTDVYSKNVEIINYQKKLLDIDRSYDIKTIIEHEAYENKKFQEINNNYEIDMVLSIQLNNLDFNKSSNEMRLNNTLKTLRDERNYDEIDALHQIEVEKLAYQIRSLRYEIQSFEEVQQRLHKNEDDKYNTTYNYKTVNTVLEIEKYKVLNTLNHSMYDLNIKSTQSNLDNAKKSNELKNKEYEFKNKSRINRNKMVLNCERALVKYQIECFKKEESLELSILNRNYFYQLDSLGHEFLSNKFILEYKYIMQEFSTLTKIFKQTNTLLTKCINSILNSIQYRPEYASFIWKFMEEFFQLFSATYKDYLLIHNDRLDSLINERLDLEKETKYRGFYKNIESKYKSDLFELNNNKNKLARDFQINDNNLDRNKSTLYALENDILIKRKQLQKHKDQRIIDSLNETHNLHKQLDAENIKLTKKNNSLQKEINQINQQINQITFSYKRQQDDIRRMQLTNSKSYNDLEKGFDKQLTTSTQMIINKMNFDKSYELTDYEKIIKEKTNIFILAIKDFLMSGYDLINNFRKNEQDAILKSANILKNGYLTDLEEINQEAKVEKASAKAIYMREDGQRSDDIKKFDSDVQNTLAKIKDEILKHEDSMKKSTIDFQKEKDFINHTFYSEYYAVCANQNDIRNKHENDLVLLDTQYEKAREEIFEKFKKYKEDIKISLHEYIQSRNEIIHRLPVAAKAQEKTIKDSALNSKLELNQTYSTVKIKNQTSKKEVEKNIDLIRNAFLSKQVEIQKEYKINRVREKREHLRQMRRI